MEKEIDINAVLMHQDNLLETIVHTANKSGIQIGVTLSVKGTLITGIIISGKEYFDLLASDMRSVDNVGGEVLGDSFEKIGKELYEDYQDNRNTVYIHLKDAVYVYPNGTIPSSQRILWRGKIASVDGYSLVNF